MASSMRCREHCNGVHGRLLDSLLSDPGSIRVRSAACERPARKDVPSRKTDVFDCQWLQYLHSVGLLRASFRPQQAVCAIGSIVRHRDGLVQMASTHVQHMQKALDQMNLQLHHVISDITGLTGMAMLDAILGGERNPQKLSKLRHPRFKSSEETIAAALVGDVTELSLEYVVGVQSSASVWEPGKEPLPAKAWKGQGRPPRLLRRDKDHKPVSVKQLAFLLSAAVWKTVNWRQGTKQKLRSRFAAVRIRPAHRDEWQAEPHPEEWLLIEWPKKEAEPTKYWLSTLPPGTKLKELVALAKQRWIIEQNYEELKQELGLGHYEGRGWRGFHHHATLCIAAYGFLLAEEAVFPPSHTPAISNYQSPNSRPDFARADRVRPERHNPYSIATLRIQLSRHLLGELSCCPFCGPKRL